MSEAPTTQERYSTATHSNSLCVDARTTGDVDYLIAAAWGSQQFGAALMRLQAEFDGAGRRLPKRPSRSDVFHAARVSMGKGITKVTASSTKVAKDRLQASYDSEMRMLVQPLKSLRSVRRHLAIKLLLDGMPDSAVDQIILQWLSPKCPLCCGRGLMLKRWSDTELSDDKCMACAGKGELPPPEGAVGAKAIRYMDSCMQDAGGRICGKTHSSH